MGYRETRLSILIPTLDGRELFLDTLYTELKRQINGLPIEILINKDNKEKSIGKKRNELIEEAKGEYIAFFDDDDTPSEHYIIKQMQGCQSGLDCNSLIGNYYLDGVFDRPFIHSIKYKDWYSDHNFHYRCPNHLNAIRRDLVKDIKFEEINFGEDGRWSMEIMRQGRLKTEFEIKETIYHYYHRSNK